MLLTPQHISLSKPRAFGEIMLVPLAVVTHTGILHGEAVVVGGGVVTFSNDFTAALDERGDTPDEDAANRLEIEAAARRALTVTW